MAQLLDVLNVDSQSFTTVLDSQRIRIFLYFLQSFDPQTTNGWYIDIENLSGQNVGVIVTGLKLQTFQRVIQKYSKTFQGDIIVEPTSIPFTDLTQDEPWGNTHRLIYFTQSEIETLDSTISASSFSSN